MIVSLFCIDDLFRTSIIVIPGKAKPRPGIQILSQHCTLEILDSGLHVSVRCCATRATPFV